MSAQALLPAPAAGQLAACGLRVVLRFERGAEVIAREVVTAADLVDARGELWRDACLRAGLVMQRFDALVPLVAPRFSAIAPSRCVGFALVADPPSAGAAALRGEFSVFALELVARRAEARLRQAGVLQPGQSYFYEIEVAPSPAASAPAAGFAALELTANHPPLRFLSLPLAPLRERARPEGPADDGQFPVFFTAAAFAKAERFSRHGAAFNPPVESGAVLVGPLCTCPHSGELFVVVTDACEVTDAEAGVVSLAYSGRSWARIQTMVRARQAADPALRILGQAHGHNFPVRSDDCANCPKQDVCAVDNVFASTDDHAWMRAVFARQPWALCQIFGLNIRGAAVDGLFTLSDGRPQRRGLLVLPPDHDLPRDPVITVNQ